MSKLLIALARLFLGMARTVGIVPFSFCFKRKVATTSNLWRCYSCAVLIGIVVVTPLGIRIIYTRMHFLRQQPLLSFVGFNRFTVLHLCAMFTIFNQLLKYRSVIYCCNEAIRIYDSLRSFPTSANGLTFDKRVLVQLMIKVGTLIPITHMIVFYIVFERALQHPYFLMSLLAVYYCQMMLIMTFNMFYGTSILLTAFIRHLNRSLESIFRDIRRLKRKPGRANSLKMQKYCEFADAVDKIMDFHRKIVALGKIVNQQYQVQIVCYLLYVSVECIVQSYIQYFVLTENRHRCDKGGALSMTAISYVLAWLVDLVLVINAAEELANLSAETKWIVRIGEEVGIVDVRLERMLEQFSIYLQDEKMSFTACGMFVVDNRCLFMMCQRLLTSMLILMQFDAILKYKQ